jgi:hypothetical protein
VSRGVTWKKTTRWIDRPLRTCRSLHHCSVCDKAITIGQSYFDGGYGKRAHEACVDVEAEKAADKQEQQQLGAIVKALR